MQLKLSQMKNEAPILTVCPCTLKEGYNTYSPYARRKLFDGKRVSHILQYLPPTSEENAELFRDNRKRISISGVQEKVSVLLDGKTLRLTNDGEQGTYILKPIPRDLKKVNEVPANEHLTMQIAEQIYGIRTAQNGLIFFMDGTPAYITKRFDIRTDGTKLGKEDFASLAGMTEPNAGPGFKYDYNYNKLGTLIRKFVPAWRFEIEYYFEAVYFNYLFSNGDAHLKNFALLETIDGDYRLSPFYDLINTHMHIGDTPFALNGGLFDDAHRSDIYLRTGYPNRIDFVKFGSLLGVQNRRLEKILERFNNVDDQLIESMIDRSFLSDSGKRGYTVDYRTRRNKLEAS